MANYTDINESVIIDIKKTNNKKNRNTLKSEYNLTEIMYELYYFKKDYNDTHII